LFGQKTIHRAPPFDTIENNATIVTIESDINMPSSDKIKTVESLALVLASIRGQKSARKIVLCHGVFDLLHVGHIRHFEQAKKLGDILVVTVTPDIYVNKGPRS
jgi:bifunctional ADP-heptose synthase (sugar kinase/adenylyltransferase)